MAPYTGGIKTSCNDISFEMNFSRIAQEINCPNKIEFKITLSNLVAKPEEKHWEDLGVG
jgi:hypothetical protein